MFDKEYTFANFVRNCIKTAISCPWEMVDYFSILEFNYHFTMATDNDLIFDLQNEIVYQRGKISGSKLNPTFWRELKQYARQEKEMWELEKRQEREGADY